ncbi:MAG TPA: 6,7-dimethyl-8-ribityllumazine synthase [Gaiellaceae bacterium]|nr:6,7-dimethyl-8-ribityllumazine synthase [Gaiellaceae bacterium]
MSSRDIDESSENVLAEWSDRREAELAEADDEAAAADDAGPAWGMSSAGVSNEIDAEADDAEALAIAEPEPELESQPEPEAEPQSEPAPFEPEPLEPGGTPIHVELSHEHAAGDLHIPDGYAVLEGVAEGGRRAVGVVVSRFNGKVTTELLDRALEELAAVGVQQETITIMVVPGAFELPLAATALAKTRRFACIVALGCIIRGDTPHFDYVASEAASGLQLAALETGVPVSFGVLTLDRVEQAEPRIEKGAEAVRSALEMADLFSQLRAAAAR